MMRLKVGVISLLALFGTPAIAAADSIISYEIDFSLAAGSPAPTSGSFDYDPSLATDPFSNFVVEWDGLTFDLTSSANDPSILNAPTCINGATGAAATFQLLTECPSDLWNWSINNFAPDFALGLDYETGPNYLDLRTVTSTSLNLTSGAYGTLSSVTTPEAIPESSTVIFMLIGLGLLMRNRLARDATPLRASQ
jgi:hypothetical protein